MRTLRNLGDRAKLTSYMMAMLARIWRHWRVWDPLDSSRKQWILPLRSRSMTRAVIFLEVSAAPINRDARRYEVSLD
ncbi:hypothetical protein TNCV_4032441 [Trichonephila clavipes]|nr:hypothetical protein TNCV_4032441 [Trichonephila clavipes]